MAINDLFGSVKRKAGVGILGLGLVLGYGCGDEDKNYTCEDACDALYTCFKDWGAYDKRENCIKDCKNEPWSQEFIKCLVDSCSCDMH